MFLLLLYFFLSINQGKILLELREEREPHSLLACSSLAVLSEPGSHLLFPWESYHPTRLHFGIPTARPWLHLKVSTGRSRSCRRKGGPERIVSKRREDS